MKQLWMVFASALVLAAPAAMPAAAQNAPQEMQDTGRPVTPRDVLVSEDRTDPAPENGDIIVLWQTSRRIYFKYPIKSIRIDDEYTVKAVPQSEHVVAFSGLSPGHTSVTIENKNGEEKTWGFATVVREPHEVKIYQPAPSKGQGGGGSLISVTNNNVPPSGSDATSQSQGDYRSVLCNEIGCTQPPPPSTK